MASVGSAQVANELDVSEPEVSRLCGYTGGWFGGVRFVEEPIVGPDDPDSRDFLDDLGEEHKVASDLGLRDLLRYLRARRGRVTGAASTRCPSCPRA